MIDDLLFIASRLGWTLLEPLNLLAIALLLATWMAVRGRHGAARRLLVGISTVVLAVTLLPVGEALVIPLEQRFGPVHPLPRKVHGIVMLGGAQIPGLTAYYGQPALNEHAERVTTFLALARAYPDARLVFTGGSGDPFRQDLTETQTVRLLLEEQQVDMARVSFEQRSRNTWENAVLAKAMVAPAPGETWLLVTSAFHLPRAIGAFRRAGWAVVPVPCDYLTLPELDWTPDFNVPGSFRLLSLGLHEWLGLAVYYLTGRSDSPYPGPSS